MVQFIVFFKFYIIFFFLVVNYLLEQIFKAFSRLIVGALGSLLCFTQKHLTPIFSLLISESLLFSVFLKVNFPSITTPTPLQRSRNPYTILNYIGPSKHQSFALALRTRLKLTRPSHRFPFPLLHLSTSSNLSYPILPLSTNFSPHSHSTERKISR